MASGRGWLAAAAGSVGGEALAEYGLNMPVGVTSISREIYGLHMLILWVCVAIAAVVFGALGYSLWRYRKERHAVPAEFHEHTGTEIAWTVIPFLILALMAIPATLTLVSMHDTADADLTIKITGSQWRWRYEYLDNGVAYFSNLATPQEQRDNSAPKGEHYLLEVDDALVVPVGAKVRLLLTSADVIHAWWVPRLGVKKDAVPGFINESWARIDQAGIYRGQCAELCGVGHAYMPIVVEAKSPDDFAAWMAERRGAAAAEAAAGERTFTLAELMGRGEKVYATNCAVCHQATGLGLPGVFPPLKGSPVATGPLPAHLEVVLKGRSGTAMPGFGQLGDADIAAVLTYERNAWDNATGDVVQPAAVKTARAAAPATVTENTP